MYLSNRFVTVIDKVFLKKMISSVPARVEAMVKLEGAQVHKSDYQKISGAGDSKSLCNFV